MASKVISISMTEAQIWKLEQLEKRTGISKSGLIQKGLMLLISELSAFAFPEGLIGSEATEEDLEEEYSKREV